MAKLEKMNEFFDARVEIYDNHMLNELNLKEFYEAISQALPKIDYPKILDLGCGTGLELEYIFSSTIEAEITCVDISQKMLEKLLEKYHGRKKQLKLICSSYFDLDYGKSIFDYALSTYSLHHFSTDIKSSLYQKVYNSLKHDGVYIEGDTTVKTISEEKHYINENKRKKKEQGISEGFFHYDTPLAISTQKKLFHQAGFSKIDIYKKWENTTIFICKK